MKFVRWLGAYGMQLHSIDTYAMAIRWELTQHERQIAVEPLWRGRSILPDAEIGLELDHSASLFICAWCADMYTEANDKGQLVPEDFYRGTMPRYRNLNRFLSVWNRQTRSYHGEAVFASPVYKSLVVKKGADLDKIKWAGWLANKTGLPFKML